MYYELTPAYGRDYKTGIEVREAFLADKDFEGDYKLGFQLVNRPQLPKPCTVMLRYDKQRRVTRLEVAASAKEAATTPKDVCYACKGKLSATQCWICGGEI